jgi:hypothetical protein
MSSSLQQKPRSVLVRWAVPALVASLVLLCSPLGLAVATAGEEAPLSRGRWAFLAGYGMSHPGTGKSKVWVETVDLVPRYERERIDDLGAFWYRGRPSLLVELPIHLVVDPAESPMFGINLLPCWNFTAKGTLQPYLFAGGGLVYTDADIQGLGARLNANYQVGGGLRYRLSSERYLLFEYRLHHLSNGDKEHPNCPINSSKISIGVTF